METPARSSSTTRYCCSTKASPPAAAAILLRVMAHEVAHHWFGDLRHARVVGRHLLNESFAEWMGVKIARPSCGPELGSRADLVYSATYRHGRGLETRRRPMHQASPTTAQISSTFDSITYQKGGSVLSMVESYLGEETFRDGVRSHLQRHQHGVATSGEFFEALSAAAKQQR